MMKRDNTIQLHDPLDIKPRPEQYLLDFPLQKAVETAIRFNQPLLLTGEPGTGKTQLAYKVAHQLHAQTNGQFAAEPLRFNTKTTSQARDLFYLYDAIGHFQQANIKGSDALRPTRDYIELQALGQAIAYANPKAEYAEKCRFTAPDGGPKSSVVLVDEVDKAPRDFSNDILNEVENREFFIKEQDNYRIGMDKSNAQRIVLIMTSNSEKNLPEAFLRRCVFYHIPTPTGDKLREILKAHLSLAHTPVLEQSLDNITKEFELLRKKVTRKAPATAELVALVKLLEAENIFRADKPIEAVKQLFRDNIALLIKTKEDLEAVREYL